MKKKTRQNISETYHTSYIPIIIMHFMLLALNRTQWNVCCTYSLDYEELGDMMFNGCIVLGDDVMDREKAVYTHFSSRFSMSMDDDNDDDGV